MNNIISDLFQLLNDYFTYQQFQKDKLLQQKLNAKILLERELHQQLRRSIQKYNKLCEKQPYRNYEYYLSAYFCHETQDYFLISNDKRAYNTNLQSKSELLDLYYFANKLRIACDMASRNMVINAGFATSFLKELLLDYEKRKEDYADIPALYVYYEILQMLQKDEAEAHYYGLKKSLEQCSAAFPDEELNTIYSYLLNFCVKKINSGETAFYQEILSLYKTLLSKKILLNNGFLSQWDYTNINTSALRLEEFDWAENFLKEHKEELLPDKRFNVFTYNLTAFYFAKQDYDKALKLLNEVEFTDAFYNAAAKIIQMKVYFELDETEAFYALAEAFKKFISRNKQFSAYQKKSNFNFIKAASWTYKQKLKAKLDKKKIAVIAAEQQLWHKIQKLEPLGNKAWLKGVLEDSTS